MLSSAAVKTLCRRSRRCRARARVQASRTYLWTLGSKVRLNMIIIMAILLFKCQLCLLCPRILICRQLSCLLLILTCASKCKRVRNESRIVIARVSAPATAERSYSDTSTAVGEGGGPLIVLVVEGEDIVGIDGIAGGVMTVRPSSVPASTALLADNDRNDKHQDHRTSGRNTGNSSDGESSCARGRGSIGGGGGGDG